MNYSLLAKEILSRMDALKSDCAMNAEAVIANLIKEEFERSEGTKATGIEAMVCDDIVKRQQVGIRKYGVTVADNPLELLEWIKHAYEESLDLTIYLRRTISELESMK